jgi:hypothetical protein
MAVSFAWLAGCGGTTPSKPEGPPPPQNLVGSTDQLQLVTELSLNLAREYGASRLMVVLGVDGTLLADTTGEASCANPAPLEVHAVQEDTAEQVRRIRDAGIPVVFATRRSESCRFQTAEQLARIGIPENGGVLYTGGEAKGPALHQMLKSSGGNYPLLIIMADNEQKNLSSVMKEFSELGTKVHSWRYTRIRES